MNEVEALEQMKTLEQQVIGKRWKAFSVSGEYYLGEGVAVRLSPDKPTLWQNHYLVSRRVVLKFDDGASLDVAIICLKEIAE